MFVFSVKTPQQGWFSARLGSYTPDIYIIQVLFAPAQSWTPLYIRRLPPSYYYKVFVFTGLKITHTCTQDIQSHYKRYCNARKLEENRVS